MKKISNALLISSREEKGIHIYIDPLELLYFSKSDANNVVKNPFGVLEGFVKIEVFETIINCRTLLGTIYVYLRKSERWKENQDSYICYDKSGKYSKSNPNTVYIYLEQLTQQVKVRLMQNSIKPKDITLSHVESSAFQKKFFKEKINAGFLFLFIYKEKEYQIKADE